MVSRRSTAILGAAAAAASVAVFWRTAYPTITWWDSSSYSLAAATLGITSSPGSLLLTLLGWAASRLPLGLAPAHLLNLVAGLLGAIAAGLVFVVATRVLRRAGETSGGTAIGAASGALAFAFSATLWEHAIKFTPYVLTAVVTALILLAMMQWWEAADRPGSWRWLFLIGALLGLDFSVHRTNALLIPALLAWILVRRPREVLRPGAWASGLLGVAAGLSVHLLVMPISTATSSPLNMFEPNEWGRFWDYVSLAQAGGGFLVDLWPRNADLWSVQAADFLRVMRENLLHWATPAGLLGLLPALAALAGIALLLRRDRRLGLAFVLVILLHAAATVLYFNIPAAYFRPFDRHYLPVFVTIGVMMACGLGAVTGRVARAATARRFGIALPAAAIVALVPVAQLTGNWRAHDASARWFTRDYAANALAALPPNAIYFTVGDNDTFPVMYLQAVERVRPDVRIVNMSMANTSWYVDQITERDPTFPISQARRETGSAPPMDTITVIPIRNTPEGLGLPAGSHVPESVTVTPRPFLGPSTLPADLVLVDLVRTNAWRDPLTFAITAAPNGPGWLTAYARLDGLFWRIVPVPAVTTNRDVVRDNLLARYSYRGYADSSIVVDDVSAIIGRQYYPALGALLDAERATGNRERCRLMAATLFAALPPSRVRLPAADREALEARCRS
jgi:hypothetical protein